MAKSQLARNRSNKASRTRGRKAVARAKSRAPDKVSRAKWVYRFGNGRAEGSADMRDLLGGKGAGLAEMANLGLPVPPGFTITTAVCTYYYANGKTYPKGLDHTVAAALAEIGRITGKSF